MTPDGWWALALALVASCIAGLVVVAWRLGGLDGNGGHTHRNVRLRAADPFADPADRDDPHGDNWPPPADPDDFWERHAPRTPTAPDLATGTGQFPMLPPDPDPDPTLIQPADVMYLGKPSGEYVDELFSKHAPDPADLAARYLT